jgi:hypothetical protein
MKSVFFSALLAASILNVAPVKAAAATVDEAKTAFGQREYDNAGIQKAQAAADIYAQLATEASDTKAKAELLVRQSEALYFVGDADKANAVKIEKHNQGYQLADQAVKSLGVKDVSAITDAEVASLKSTLSAADLALLGDALYYRGTNLGKWGQANGVTTSLGRWPELRATMELVGKLGLESVHEYGAARTLGKAYATLPGLLGGSTKKALEYLSKAVSKSAAPGQKYSTNGFNNLFYAEVLNENGDTDEAKALLEAFITADPATLNPSLVAETRRAQADAKEMLKDF